MSQPLTGQVRRRLHEISVYEGWFLLALADMVDHHTQEWREPWYRLVRRFGRKNQWRIREVAYRLRNHGWLSIHSDGRGVIIRIHPNQGRPTVFLSDEVATPGSNQIATPGSSIDSPPHTPPGANAPRTRSKVKRVVDTIPGGELRGSKSPPSSSRSKANKKAAPGRASNGVLAPSERISLEREIDRLQREIARIRGRDPQDRTEDECLKLRAFKARVDHDLLALGQIPIYQRARAVTGQAGERPG